MSVILAATSLASQNGAFSPQHVNNWSVEIHGLSAGGPILNGSDSLTFSLSRGFLPTVGVDEVAIPFGNESVYVAGRARYEGGTLEVRDYVDQDIQGRLREWYSLVYGGVKGNWGIVGVPSSYKRVGDILFTAPDGEQTFPTRYWRCEGLWPVQANFGNLDMGSSEQVQIAISLRYDRAQYMGSSTSITSGIAA
jgi:hypothetical protein